MSEKSRVVGPDRSPVIMTEMVLPIHTNAQGNIFGGTVMSWIDIAGAIAARRYSRCTVVTVSIDYLHFIVPIKIGYIVRVNAKVTYVGKTSMEVEALVDAENTETGEVRRATTAYLTYVAIDEYGRPKRLTPIKPEDNEDKKRIKQAEKRRAFRLERAREEFKP